MNWADEQIQSQEKTLLDEFKAAGVTILTPDVAAFRRATLAAVPPKFEAKWGKGTYESIATMK
jgi:TRAP-type C4-dicarboxylate transport system substrate-binding protein